MKRSLPKGRRLSRFTEAKEELNQASLKNGEVKGISSNEFGKKPDILNVEATSEPDLHEGLFIANAGAVLFAPFLPALFEKLKLLKDDVLKEPEVAVLLIQYAVSGGRQVLEYELVLPKILCGLSIDFAVNTTLEITEEQAAETDRMLEAVISHWSVLKDTTLAGLREAFLQRAGKISLTDTGWQLVVEQKAYDLLLERLPWSISMLRLPWMDKLLRTDWI